MPAHWLRNRWWVYGWFGGRSRIRYNKLKILMADDKLYRAEYLGSGTFIISKPKRKTHKQRQSRLRAPRRGARK